MRHAAVQVSYYAVLLALDHVLWRSSETKWRHYERLDRALDHLLARWTETA